MCNADDELKQMRDERKEKWETTKLWLYSRKGQKRIGNESSKKVFLSNFLSDWRPLCFAKSKTSSAKISFIFYNSIKCIQSTTFVIQSYYCFFLCMTETRQKFKKILSTNFAFEILQRQLLIAFRVKCAMLQITSMERREEKLFSGKRN